MRRFIATGLLCLLLLGLCACQLGDGIKEPVDFYYKRSSFLYGAEDGVIAAEQREASGHREDLNYLLSLYLQGPLDGGLKSPFPAGCEIVEVSKEEKSLRVILNQTFAQLENLDLTIGCACLAKTCFALTDTQSVTIQTTVPDGTGAVQITLTREDLLLYDNSEPVPSETE